MTTDKLFFERKELKKLILKHIIHFSFMTENMTPKLMVFLWDSLWAQHSLCLCFFVSFQETIVSRTPRNSVLLNVYKRYVDDIFGTFGSYIQYLNFLII